MSGLLCFRTDTELPRPLLPLISLGGEEVMDLVIVKDHVTRKDVDYLSHILALCIATVVGKRMIHRGVTRLSDWSKRDASRGDVWFSVRSQIPSSVFGL
eukprot:1737188-Amphidinium_carterae.1